MDCQAIAENVDNLALAHLRRGAEQGHANGVLDPEFGPGMS
ncbi:hypothetical protein [Microvirga rosea]|nr:hypothetical protein [Microvirga rosea]